MSFDSWNKTFPYINLPYAFSSEKKNLHPFLSSGPFGLALWFLTACASLESWLHFSHQSLCRVSMWIIGVCLASGDLRNRKVWFKCQTATWKASGDAEPRLWSNWGNANAKLNRKSLWVTKGCPLLDLWHGQHGLHLQCKKERFRAWHKVTNPVKRRGGYVTCVSDVWEKLRADRISKTGLSLSS